MARPLTNRLLALFLALALIAASCSGSDSPETAPPATAAPTTAALPTTSESAPADPIAIELDQADGCELIGAECLLPFPSDALTAADAGTTTGRRVAIPAVAMPSNADGAVIDVARQNRADGFSPGSAALVLLPGIDPEGSALPPVTDIARSLDADSGSIVLDATTGELWAHWAELDANATDPARQGLFVRPARNYLNGHRIVIGLRNLVDSDGTAIEPNDVFRAYRDGVTTDNAVVEARRVDMDRIFDELASVGVVREELVMAWEFTVISTESLTSPLVHMRDDAFAILGDAAPDYTIESAVRNEGDAYVTIEGTYEVPLYLTDDGAPGNGLNLPDGADLPEANGTFSSVFRCMVHDNTTAAEPAGGVIYGHGLLGTRNQVTSTGPRLLAENHNHVICGTDLIGMADEDALNATQILGDVSAFFTLSDRLLQGHLNTLFLGRLMRHAEGFAADPAFQDAEGNVLLDVEQLAYYGISQGGIMGPVSTAVSTDWDRGVFGVPGINYSTLLNRSVDFDLYQAFLDPAYPDKLDQATALLVIQMLWDRSEGNGYVNYYAEPLDGVGQKSGLLHGALGDHQVANVAMDVMARSMEAAAVWPAVADDRTFDVDPMWAIDRIGSFPYEGSAVVMWDSGSPIAPIENVPPRDGEDPHEDPRRHLDAVAQVDAFLRTGTVIDMCGGEACISPARG